MLAPLNLPTASDRLGFRWAPCWCSAVGRARIYGAGKGNRHDR